MQIYYLGTTTQSDMSDQLLPRLCSPGGVLSVDPSRPCPTGTFPNANKFTSVSKSSTCMSCPYAAFSTDNATACSNCPKLFSQSLRCWKVCQCLRITVLRVLYRRIFLRKRKIHVRILSTWYTFLSQGEANLICL